MFEKYYFRKHSALGSDGATEGGGDVPPEEGAGPAIEIPEGKEWLQGADPDIINDPSMKAITDVATLAKSYVHAQKMVGKDKVVVPDKNSSEEDWKAFYKRVGLPDKEEYNVDFEEGVFDQDTVAKINELGYENNLTPSQVKAVMGFAKEHFDSRETASSEELEQQIQEELDDLREEWGEEGFKTNLVKANVVLDEFGSPELKQYLNDSGLGNDAQLIRLLANIGNNLKEDSFSPEMMQTFGMTKQDAQEKLDDIFGNMEHPYWNAEHASHGKAVKEVNKYQQILAK